MLPETGMSSSSMPDWLNSQLIVCVAEALLEELWSQNEVSKYLDEF